MTKDDFLQQLEKALVNLPPQELEDALAYYTEYFYEWGPEGEQEAIQTLGSPQKVAQSIIAQSGLREVGAMPPSIKRSAKSIWLVVLAVFAAPIALPLAIALGAVVFSLFVSVAAFFFSLFVGAGAILISGVALIVTSLFAFTIHFWTGLFAFGAGFITIGLGLLFLMGTLKIFGWFSRWARKLAAKILSKGDKNESLS